jgi:hypothetical protein
LAEKWRGPKVYELIIKPSSSRTRENGEKQNEEYDVVVVNVDRVQRNK